LVAPLTCAVIALALALSACGDDDWEPPEAIPIGTSAGHRLPPLSPAVREAQPVGAMTCEPRRDRQPRYGIHVELFGDRQSSVIPAGIGIAPPHRGRRPFVTGGRCEYPLRTREPTGVIEVARTGDWTLGDFFELWGQPLSRTRAGDFTGPVRLWLDGKEWTRAPAELPLHRHAQIVVVVGEAVPVHDDYLFPPGL
jgi:hypothetical protein